MVFEHRSVLLEECISNLEIKPGGIYADGTLGGGGHSLEIAKRLRAGGHLYCFDKDDDAIEAASGRLEAFRDRVTIIKDDFSAMEERLRELGVGKLDGVLLDLGVSSHQLDEAERGFSYMQDAPLDMRMDRENTLDARRVVNEYSREELIRVMREYGEEPFAANIARHIIESREKKPIEKTGELADIIKMAIPMKIKKHQGHPAKRTFQAIRIEVNGELSSLERLLDSAPQLLGSGGRLCIITFHSLEDRMVKKSFRKWENPCICPPDFPVCTCGRKSLGRVITRKPIIPGDEERTGNPRSQSAKLRVFERNDEFS